MVAMLRRLVSRWSEGRAAGYRPRMSGDTDEHLKLEQAFTECSGQWVAVNRRTGEVVAARPSPYELSAHLKSNRIQGVDIVRAPDQNEPEVVGIG